jgi:hypothetical protein
VNGRVLLHLEAARDHDQPLAIAFVGYTNGVASSATILWGVSIPRDHGETWRVHLEAVDAARPNDTVPPPENAALQRVHVWPREPLPEMADKAGCLAYQYWQKDEGKWKTLFFVPNEDRDCDGMDPECNDYWYDYNVGVPNPVSSCVTSAGPLYPGSCTLGNDLCVDGQPQLDDCRQTSDPVFCVPGELCTLCDSQPDLVTCARSELAHANAVLRYDCSFAPDMQSGELPCDGGTGLDAGSRVVVHLVGAGNCGVPTLRSIADPKGTPVTSIGAVQLAITHASYPTECDIFIRWVGGSSIGAFAAPQLFLLEVPFPARPSTPRLLIPVRLGLANAIACNDLIWDPKCIANMPNPQTNSMFTCATN